VVAVVAQVNHLERLILAVPALLLFLEFHLLRVEAAVVVRAVEAAVPGH
jgi:hypothetical protein